MGVRKRTPAHCFYTHNSPEAIKTRSPPMKQRRRIAALIRGGRWVAYVPPGAAFCGVKVFV
jgi:hypothetical protein